MVKRDGETGKEWIERLDRIGDAKKRFEEKHGFKAFTEFWAHGYEFSLFGNAERGKMVLYCSKRPYKDIGTGEVEYLLNKNGQWEEFQGAITDGCYLDFPAPVPKFDEEAVE